MINIKNLSFSYNNKAPYIIDNINLDIDKGTYVSILGENGSGKSTLLKLILKILKPTSGSVNIKTNNIGYVPQRLESFNSQFPISVYEILNCHAKALKIKNPDFISKSLEMVDMLPFKNTLIGNLSGGQQQKIFIARALIGTPELLILDEPSTGIDIQSQDDIYKIIKKLNFTDGMTVLSVEHNFKAALSNSSHIYRLDKGHGTLYSIEEYKKLKNLDIEY